MLRWLLLRHHSDPCYLPNLCLSLCDLYFQLCLFDMCYELWLCHGDIFVPALLLRFLPGDDGHACHLQSLCVSLCHLLLSLGLHHMYRKLRLRQCDFGMPNMLVRLLPRHLGNSSCLPHLHLTLRHLHLVCHHLLSLCCRLHLQQCHLHLRTAEQLSGRPVPRLLAGRASLHRLQPDLRHLLRLADNLHHLSVGVSAVPLRQHLRGMHGIGLVRRLVEPCGQSLQTVCQSVRGLSDDQLDLYCLCYGSGPRK